MFYKLKFKVLFVILFFYLNYKIVLKSVDTHLSPYYIGVHTIICNSFIFVCKSAACLSNWEYLEMFDTIQFF